MIFFDYVYFKCCNWYYSYESSRNEYKSSGMILTCAFFGLNVAILIGLIEHFFAIKLVNSKYEILYYSIPATLPFIIRYWSGKRYEITRDKVSEMGNQKKILLQILMILYVIISVPGTIILAIYIHKLKNG